MCKNVQIIHIKWLAAANKITREESMNWNGWTTVSFISETLFRKIQC